VGIVVNQLVGSSVLANHRNPLDDYNTPRETKEFLPPSTFFNMNPSVEMDTVHTDSVGELLANG
jgi:hypothetical protein